MTSFRVDDSDEALLKTIDDWVELLAHERYGDALAVLPSREHWTPDLLRRVIEGYGSPEPHPSGRIFHVTSPRDATKGLRSPPTVTRRVERWSEVNRAGAIGFIEYDLPLDGHWSDLTALFDLKPAGHELVVELDDIHVL